MNLCFRVPVGPIYINQEEKCVFYQFQVLQELSGDTILVDILLKLQQTVVASQTSHSLYHISDPNVNTCKMI